jgi:AcrR family transcriptional regulator
MPTRSYRSPNRQDAALRTRATLLDAAESCFAADGYARVRIAEIASAAGIAVNTVYTSVGGKPELVRAILDRYVDHPVVQSALTELDDSPTADQLIHALAAGVRNSYEVTLRPASIVIDAARDDPALTVVLEAMTNPFHVRLRRVAARWIELAASTATEDAVFERFWFFLGYEAWNTLASFNWSWDERERWTARQLSNSLRDLGRSGEPRG